MAIATHRRIENRGGGHQEEFTVSGATVQPGMLTKINSSGALVVHDVVEGVTPIMVPLEDALQGVIASTAFTTATQATVLFPNKGAVVNMLVTSGQTVSIGTKLVSAGNGKLITAENATSGVLVPGILFEATEGQVAALSADTLVACRVL